MLTELDRNPEMKLNGAEVVTLRSSGRICRADIAIGAGGAPVGLWMHTPHGRDFNLLGTRTIAQLEDAYQTARRAQDRFSSNVFFQPGVAAPLFPLANRLTGRQLDENTIEATILGHRVTVPLNHGRGPDQRPHHLHGLAFDKPAQTVLREENRIKLRLPAGFFGPYWTGRVQLEVEQTLVGGVFHYEMRARNVGDTPVPAGFGAHPYFVAPSQQPGAVHLRIPGRRLVEIDDYTNVLPTGKLIPVPHGLDFREGAPLRGRHLDNLWVDLETDEQGYAFCEFIDARAGWRARMTALTRNVTGIQAYAPQNSPLGVFVALELVTNLPDPREELWGEEPTGMILLEPGEEQSYGYKIEIQDL